MIEQAEYLEVELPPGDRRAWLEWRRTGIGASDVAALLGLSPWNSPYSLWADKVGITGLDDGGGNELFEAGHYLELAMGPWWEDRTGGSLLRTQIACARGIALATLDGYGTSDDGPLVVEFKTGERGDSWGEGADGIPVYYQAQAQWQMLVSGHQRADLCFLAGRRFTVHRLDRNDDDIAVMVERATRFWLDYVVTGEPPPIDGMEATKDALAALYPRAERETVQLDRATVAPILADYRVAAADEKNAKQAKQAAANALRAMIGDAEKAVDADGAHLFAWTNVPESVIPATTRKASRRLTVPNK